MNTKHIQIKHVERVQNLVLAMGEGVCNCAADFPVLYSTKKYCLDKSVQSDLDHIDHMYTILC